MDTFASFVFFALHIIIAIVMIGTGTMYHWENTEFARLTREDIDSTSSLTLAIGILFVFFLIKSCHIHTMFNKEGYIVMSLLLLIMQLFGSLRGIVTVYNSSDSLNSTLQLDMKESIAQFYSHNDTRYIHSISAIQKKWECCGVNNVTDYNITQLPVSCCPSKHLDQNITYCPDPELHYKVGCVNIVIDHLLYNSGMVVYINIILSVVQTLGMIFIAAKLLADDDSTQDTLYHQL